MKKGHVGASDGGKTQDIRITVRDDKAAAAPVAAILITSRCVEHQLPL